VAARRVKGGGFISRHDYWEAATELFAAGLSRYLAGEAVANMVDKRAGY